MLLDRLPITYVARSMPGHRRFIDVPRSNHRASLAQPEAQPARIEVTGEKGN